MCVRVRACMCVCVCVCLCVCVCVCVQDGYLSVLEVREELDIFINSPATDYGYTIHDEL